MSDDQVKISDLEATNSLQIYDIMEVQPPKYLAKFRIPNTITFNVTTMPNWWYRTMMRLVFGFRWERL